MLLLSCHFYMLPIFRNQFTSLVKSSLVFLYNCIKTIIVYCLFYLFNSFHGVLPWTYCRDSSGEYYKWATLNCTDSEMNYTDYSVPVTQDYFDNYVLEKSSGIEEVRLD